MEAIGEADGDTVLVRVFEMLTERLSLVETAVENLREFEQDRDDAAPCGAVVSGRLHGGPRVLITKHYDGLLSCYEHAQVLIQWEGIMDDAWYPTPAWAKRREEGPHDAALQDCIGGADKLDALRDALNAWWDANIDPDKPDDYWQPKCAEAGLQELIKTATGASSIHKNTCIADAFMVMLAHKRVPELEVVANDYMWLKIPVGSETGLELNHIMRYVCAVRQAMGLAVHPTHKEMELYSVNNNETNMRRMVQAVMAGDEEEAQELYKRMPRESRVSWLKKIQHDPHTFLHGYESFFKNC